MKTKTIILRQLIADKAATPDGFFTADARVLQSEKNAAKICRQLVEAGKLFRVRAGQTTYAHFTTQTAANSWMQRHRAAVLAKAKTTISFAPKKQPAAKSTAEIVHTANTLYSTRMMGPGRYEASIPRQRIGSAGFSMSI